MTDWAKIDEEWRADNPGRGGPEFVRSLELSSRAERALVRAGVVGYETLRDLREEDLVSQKNVGAATMAEIRELRRSLFGRQGRGGESTEDAVAAALGYVRSLNAIVNNLPTEYQLRLRPQDGRLTLIRDLAP